ncbi:thioesterase [Pyrenophora tritici-repentis Pt-1C-BFP]|uniref:Thioesterase n=1 Tax=Pyrenophora tritici-repentis (strain Pt-1C-BFP) TaxID=426418 RepID=B2VV33_PYRTR|nr:thioesterase [Pyrenophora tritici-repentis Pt-1C-BFP]EDU41654.1 thioesterase [Pyrenophora tritici-repentis Pt-1C-BFP]
MSYDSDTLSSYSDFSRNSSISSTSSSPNHMRVFLVQTAKGLFSSSGGYKANLCLLRHLASRGHSVRQICYSHRGEVDAYVRTMTSSGEHNPELRKRRMHLRSGYGEAGIDLAVEELVVHDGVQYVALEKEAFDEAFGGKDNILKTMPRETANYIELQTNFFVHHPWTYLEEQTHEMPLHLHNWDKKYIGMINPCPVKGARVLLGLAKLCPQHEFLVYKSWGFDQKIGRQMEAVKNIILRPTCKDMEEAWRNIKVLLVPSLWFEAWGIVTIEAHLRGIPVISSNVGALSEAMLGLDHIVPVNPIQGDRDEEGTYIVPEQDLAPWVRVVNKLMSDKQEYERLSNKVRSITEQWIKGLDETALEKWLLSMASRSTQICM